jgi:hypothetical protein
VIAFVKRISLVLGLLLQVGCVNRKVADSLGRNFDEQFETSRALGYEVSVTRREPIGWVDAYFRVENQGLALRQSRKQLEESKRLKARQWLSLVPRLSTFVGLGNSISQLTRLESDDINARLVANFDIPNPFQFYATLYGAALQEQNAIWAHDLDRRRAFTELYAAFLEADLLRETENELIRREQTLSNLPIGDLEGAVRTLAIEKEALARRRGYHRLSVNRLLNSPGKNWDLTGRLPSISRPHRSQDIVLGERFGKLALNLQAVQIEGAILGVERVRFRQWPAVSFGLSGPPLYTTTGETTAFSSDQLMFFSGVTRSFDLTDLGETANVRDARERLMFTREILRQRVEAETVQIRESQRAYQQLLREEEALRRQIARIDNARSTTPESVLDDLALSKQLRERLIEVGRRKNQLDLQFLIWDETFWNS